MALTSFLSNQLPFLQFRICGFGGRRLVDFETQLLHLQHRALERGEEESGVGDVGRLEGRHADDDVVGVRVVADPVPVRHHGAVAHERVHGGWHLVRQTTRVI